MQVKTSELSGIVLDWSVAKCEGISLGIEEDRYKRVWLFLPLEVFNLDQRVLFTPTSDWAQGGRLLSAKKLDLDRTTGGLLPCITQTVEASGFLRKPH